MGLLPSGQDIEQAGEKLEDKGVELIKSQVAPAIQQAITNALDGLHVEVKITFDVSRKTQ